MGDVTVTVHKRSGLKRWQGRQWTWPDGPARALLLGVNPVATHALVSSFMDTTPDTLRVLESSAAGTGQEWLNFSSQVVSCGQPGNRVQVWDSLHDRLSRAPAAVAFTLSLSTPLNALRVIERACVTSRVLVDVPAGPMARQLSTFAWDVVVFEPYRLTLEDVTAAAQAARRVGAHIPDVRRLRASRPDEVLLVSASGMWHVH